MFLWIPGTDGTHSKATGDFLVNTFHAFIDLIDVITSKRAHRSTLSFAELQPTENTLSNQSSPSLPMPTAAKLGNTNVTGGKMQNRLGSSLT